MIKVIVGLGNPGKKFEHTRHNVGFRVVDELAQCYGVSWQEKGNMQVAIIPFDGQSIMLVKPQTFMNESGRILPALFKQGIKPDEIVVVHDELELPFGSIKMRQGGSHRGHNGLRSLIETGGKDCYRLRFGIGRPDEKQEVPDYVLAPFTSQERDRIASLIIEASNRLQEEVFVSTS